MSAQAKRLLRPAIRPRFLRGRTQSERGASMVEFAIVLSLLFMLVFGIIQFGFAFNRHQGLQAAAREGARIASVGGTEADVGKRVRDAQSLFDPADIQIAIDYSTDNGSSYPGGNKICDDSSSDKCTNNLEPPCSGKIGSLIRVTSTVPGAGGKYAIIIPLWGNANITFQAKGVFRCEQS